MLKKYTSNIHKLAFLDFQQSENYIDFKIRLVLIFSRYNFTDRNKVEWE